MSPRKEKKARWWRVGCGVLVGLVLLYGILGAIGSMANGTKRQDAPLPVKVTKTESSPPPTHSVAHKPQPQGGHAQPSPERVPTHYPPKTLADLHALAVLGNANAIYGFASDSVGLTGICPQPRREVLVDPRVTGQHLAEDLLGYFFAEQLDNPCGSVVFAYHTKEEAGDVYTAGRVKLDVTDASGQINMDPNASHLTSTITLDLGGALSGEQEYVVTYS